MLTVGFELEFSSVNSPEDTSRACYSGRPMHAHRTWKFRTDASCGEYAGDRGWEVNSPVCNSADSVELAIQQISHWMTAKSARANARCGFHIHVGGWQNYDKSLHSVLSFFTRYEKAFFALVSSDRRSNMYCRPLGGALDTLRDMHHLSDLDSIKAVAQESERRSWINAQALGKHQTLELRLPEGTVDESRIRGWIHLFLSVCEGLVTQHIKSPNKSIRRCEQTSTEEPYMAIHDMLIASGAYGTAAKNKIGFGSFELARKFVATRYRELHGVSYRTQVDKAVKAAQLAKVSAREFCYSA